MNIKADILKKVGELTGPMAMKLSRNAPEIALAGGVAAMLGGTVLACVTTWKKLPQRLEEHAAEVEVGREPTEAEGDAEAEPADDKAAKAKSYLKTCSKITMDYVPSALMVVGGVGMVVWSHNQLRARVAALGAAYATLEGMYSKYRARVIEEHGAIADRKYRLGLHEEEVKTVVTGKNGKEKEKTEVIEAVHPDGNGYSMYARYFDQFNSNMHVLDQEANFDFLRIQQSIANEKLQRKGYLFLNEVYDALGFQEVPEGQLVGWVKGMGDDYVDFGIFEARNADARNYVDYNGKETCFVLDFNVDGVMWDLI